jgi:hypothetical protein
LGEVYNTIETKTNKNFNVFIDLKSLELKVPTICLATGGVSGRRGRRYFSFLLWRMLIREEERHMLTYSTLSRHNSIFHSRVVLRTEDQHKPKVLGTPTADEAMR